MSLGVGDEVMAHVGLGKADLARQEGMAFAVNLEVDGAAQAVVQLDASGMDVLGQGGVRDGVARVADARDERQPVLGKREGLAFLRDAQPAKRMRLA